MDNDSFDNDEDLYENCEITSDVIQPPVTTQPSSIPVSKEPVAASKPGSDSSKGADSGRASELSDKVYALEGDQNNRDWGSGLFFSITGRPHKKSCPEKFKKATRDCCCMPFMVCNIAKRLGDPVYLPYIPCTCTAIRFKVRILGGITGTIGNDCLVTSCCWPCAVCQMHRELDDIGI